MSPSSRSLRPASRSNDFMLHLQSGMNGLAGCYHTDLGPRPPEAPRPGAPPAVLPRSVAAGGGPRPGSGTRPVARGGRWWSVHAHGEARVPPQDLYRDRLAGIEGAQETHGFEGGVRRLFTDLED